MKKDTFVMIMKAIQAQDKRDSKNGDILTQLADPEFQSHKIIFTTLMIPDVIKALEKEFDLDQNPLYGSEISYFIYDLNYGKNPMAIGCITRKDGSKVSLTTPERLYDWIMENKTN